LFVTFTSIVVDAAGALDDYTAIRIINARPEGVQLVVGIGGIITLVWAVINDTQDPNWQNIDTAQTDGWVVIPTPQTPNWT
jgi:hypothetical protein